MKNQDKKLSAFTLIELLLALLIFSVVALVLYSTFFSGLKIQQRSSENGAMYHQIKMTLDMMTGELQRSINFNFSSLSPKLKAFEGTGDRISFLIAEKTGVIKRISYYLENKDKIRIYKTLIGQSYKKNVSVQNIRQEQIPTVVLMRSEEPFSDFASGAKSSNAYEEVLLDNVQKDSFKILYAYLKSGASSLTWKEPWEQEYLPSGVRLQMILVPLEEKQKPISIVKDFYIPTGSWGEAL